MTGERPPAPAAPPGSGSVMDRERFFAAIASRPPLTALSPTIAAFLKEYLRGEKITEFRGQFVINTHFPPYPGRAWDRLARRFRTDPRERRLYSVTLAATNRCPLACGHCYNAGRSDRDVPLATIQALARELQERGAVMVTISGGEPLLRNDLADICRAFDDRSCLCLNTTGLDLTPARARELKANGLFAAGISLDSADEAEHDRRRGKPGAQRAALAALAAARDAGLYPYAVTVATRDLLERETFIPFLEFARDHGAREVHLLEPCATGRLASQPGARLTAAEQQTILAYQREVADRVDLPVLSTFTYLESPDAFGCGAGLTHFYIDGSGEVGPCNLTPISFGNVKSEPIGAILDRMQKHFAHPRAHCAGQLLARHIAGGKVPLPPDATEALCTAHLPRDYARPRFYRLQTEAAPAAGAPELTAAYDQVSGDYDGHWLSEAGRAVAEAITRLGPPAGSTVFEAGCGTGYGTAQLVRAVGPRGRVIAVDLSAGMLDRARARLGPDAPVTFIAGDALAALARQRDLDAVVTTWVLGYIPLAPFLAAAAAALKPGGRLALVVHRENSPRREQELFAGIVARDPSVMLRPVAFDFPRDEAHLREELVRAGLVPERVWSGAATFTCPTPAAVLDHLLKSGAGTVFYEALDPARREALTAEFLAGLALGHPPGEPFSVRHDYLGAIARRG